MSRLRTVLGSIGRVPTLVRTLRHLRPAQARAQIRHAVVGLPAPVRSSLETPTLAISGPTTPLLGPPAHVKRLEGGRIELLSNSTEVTGRIDWETREHGPLFAYHLHQHEYLRLAAFTPAERGAHLRDWIHRHRSGIGWDPHPISLRLVCWGKMLLTPGVLETDPDLRETLLRSMADQVETLSRGLEIRLQANHLLSNLISLVFVGLLLDGNASEAWRNHSDALLRELEAQIRPDGGHEERSPMYHSLLLESVLDLLNLCLAKAERAPSGLQQSLRETAARMLSALEVVTHADGRIALFADSAFDVAPEPAQLREYAARLGIASSADRGSACLPQTGYLRLRAGDFDLIASVAGPAPPHQPGHAHCDALSYELSVGGSRLVTDTGLFEYIPGPRRVRARSTASHATLQFDGEEQAEIWAAHRVGGRPRVELTAWDGSGSAEATCRGWSRRAPLHRRRYSVEPETVSIMDRVIGACRELRTRLPIDPEWQVELLPTRARATRESRGTVSSLVEIELPEAFDWTLERGPYYPGFGRECERFVLVGTGSRCDGAVTRFRVVG